jgi:hypothetical protein
MKRFPAISLDLETYGTEPGCVILEIGITMFDPMRDRQKATTSVFPNIEEQQGMGLQINMDTMRWWDTQPEAYERQKNAARVPVASAVNAATGFITDHCNLAEVEVWAKGSHFDLPILRVLMRDVWHFRNIHDLRTLKYAAELGGFNAPNPEPNPLPHSGWHDSIHQADEVRLLCSTIAMGR